MWLGVWLWGWFVFCGVVWWMNCDEVVVFDFLWVIDFVFCLCLSGLDLVCDYFGFIVVIVCDVIKVDFKYMVGLICGVWGFKVVVIFKVFIDDSFVLLVFG